MKTKQTLLFTMALLLAALLIACGGGESEPAAESEAATSQPAQEAPTGSGAPLTGTHTFTVVPEGSQASFIASEEFFADALAKYGIDAGENVVVGTTPGVTGEIQLDFDSAEPLQSAQFTVDMTGLQTDQNQRDDWLEDNAIQTNAFPESTFTATSATGLPETIQDGQEVSFQLNGDLTVRDVTKNVTFDVTAVISGNTLQGTAKLDLNMTDFGITPPDFVNTLTVNDPFTIEVEITAHSN
jgi:polyisoprenoid-binding protein YceI